MEIKDRMTWSEMICGTLLMVVMFVILPGIAGHIETNYERKNCEVIYIADNEITVKDSGDRTWSFYVDDNSELKLHDIVTLKMHTNFTDDTIDDDIVKGVK